MVGSFDTEVENLRQAINTRCAKNKGKYVVACVEATKELLVWLGYLRASISRHVADRVLDAVQATAIEAAGCISLGLVRPAIFSIRTQLELMLVWIYFNDHPVEWANFERTVDDYPMRGQLLKYLHSNSARFTERFKILLKHKQRTNEDPYGLLSVHVHSVSAAAAPTVGGLSSVVQDDKKCDECVKLQREVAEYLTDILAAWYADKWHDLPSNIKGNIEKRLTSSALKEFCKA